MRHIISTGLVRGCGSDVVAVQREATICGCATTSSLFSLSLLEQRTYLVDDLVVDLAVVVVVEPEQRRPLIEARVEPLAVVLVVARHVALRLAARLTESTPLCPTSEILPGQRRFQG